MLSVARASASRDLESHGQNFPRESFWNSWVPGLATLARDTSVCHVDGLTKNQPQRIRSRHTCAGRRLRDAAATAAKALGTAVREGRSRRFIP